MNCAIPMPINRAAGGDKNGVKQAAAATRNNISLAVMLRSNNGRYLAFANLLFSFILVSFANTKVKR